VRDDGGGTYAGGVPRLVRRLLLPVLPALLATAVAVPVTWYLASRDPAEPAAGATPAPAGPANRDELRAQLLAQLPDPDATGAVLMEVGRNGDSAAGLPPGRYRIHLICGRMSIQGAADAITVYLRTSRQQWTIELPCPSTALSPAEELDFTGLPAGAAVAGADYGNAQSLGLLLLLRFVPVTGEAGGDGE
jgi:hypothetical protein